MAGSAARSLHTVSADARPACSSAWSCAAQWSCRRGSSSSPANCRLRRTWARSTRRHAFAGSRRSPRCHPSPGTGASRTACRRGSPGFRRTRDFPDKLQSTTVVGLISDYITILGVSKHFSARRRGRCCEQFSWPLMRRCVRIPGRCPTNGYDTGLPGPSSLRRCLGPTACPSPSAGRSTCHTKTPSDLCCNRYATAGTSGSPSSPRACRCTAARMATPPDNTSLERPDRLFAIGDDPSRLGGVHCLGHLSTHLLPFPRRRRFQIPLG